MAEVGIVVAEGSHHVSEPVAILADPADKPIPAPLRGGQMAIVETLRGLEQRIERVEKQIIGWGRGNATCRHLITIPGYGPILSTALTATVVDPAVFTSWRHLSASFGLVPGAGRHRRQGQTRSDQRRGNGYLRRFLVNSLPSGLTRRGAMSVLGSKRAKEDPWLPKLLEIKARRTRTGSSSIATEHGLRAQVGRKNGPADRIKEARSNPE
jgi:transposase